MKKYLIFLFLFLFGANIASAQLIGERKLYYGDVLQVEADYFVASSKSNNSLNLIKVKNNSPDVWLGIENIYAQGSYGDVRKGDRVFILGTIVNLKVEGYNTIALSPDLIINMKTRGVANWAVENSTMRHQWIDPDGDGGLSVFNNTNLEDEIDTVPGGKHYWIYDAQTPENETDAVPGGKHYWIYDDESPETMIPGGKHYWIYDDTNPKYEIDTVPGGKHYWIYDDTNPYYTTRDGRRIKMYGEGDKLILLYNGRELAPIVGNSILLSGSDGEEIKVYCDGESGDSWSSWPNLKWKGWDLD